MTSDSLPLEQIRDLSANYSDRQGLRVVPMALFLMVQSLPAPYVMPSSVFGIDTILLTVIIGLGGYFMVGRYYEHRFGKVEPMPDDGLSAFVFIGLLVIFFPFGILVDLLLHPPVFMSGLVIAGLLMFTAWPARHVRGQYMGAGVMLALVSLERLWGESLTNVGRTYGFVFGALLLLAGVRDHMEFVRLFPPMEQKHE
ncbi:MAG TPA: hypothetical protein VGK31_12080 [Thermoanaerobaculia bacterium]|jgi:hypothetical protein